MSYIKVSPKQAYEELLHCASCKLVPYLKSSPGMGKSSIVQQIANDFSLKLIDLRLSQCMPEDLQGFPMREGSKATFVPFDTFPIEGDELPDGKEGWLLFLDELSSANKQVQAAAYKVILDRMVGSHKLHEKLVIMAAGNLSTDKAVVVQMSTALQSRVIHYELDLDPQEWIKWAIGAGLDKRVIAFIAYKPSMLMKFDPNQSENTFPCPRTWEFLSRLAHGQELSNELLPRVAGTIGEGTGVEFLAFAREFDRLPKLESILNNPTGTPVPPNLATRYATAVMLSEHVTKETVPALIAFMDRFDVEMRVIFMRMALMVDKMLPQKSPEFTKHMRNMAAYLQ